MHINVLFSLSLQSIAAAVTGAVAGAVPTDGFDGALSDMDNHGVAHGVVVTKDKQLGSDSHDVLATIANGESPEFG